MMCDIVALHAAVRNGNVDIIDKYVSDGYDIEFSQCGWTVLYDACFFGHISVVRYLLENGADPNHSTRQWNDSPLHIAAFKGFTEVAKILLEFGADITAKNLYKGNTPLHDAMESETNCQEVIIFLVKSGADITIENEDGKTIFDYPSIKYIWERYEMISTLKEWRPWNHNKYHRHYREAIVTLVMLAKCTKK